MDGILSGRQHSKVEDPCPQPLYKDQCTKVPISCDENAALFSRYCEQPFIIRLREPNLSDLNSVVPQPREEACSRRINVLVKQKLHVEVAVR